MMIVLDSGESGGVYIFYTCRREVFEHIGGLDETLFGGEEIFFSKALKKQGAFFILPESVNTSSRKMHMYSCHRTFARLVKTINPWNAFPEKPPGHVDVV